MSKHRTGRPDAPLLTPALIEEVCNALAHGCTITTAVKIAGVSPSAFYRWLDKGSKELDQLEPGQEPQTIYGQLVLGMARAHGEARQYAEQFVWERKPELWLARHPETRREWGESAKIDLQATVSAVADGPPPQVMASSEQDLLEVARILFEIGALKPEDMGLPTLRLPAPVVAQDQADEPEGVPVPGYLVAAREPLRVGNQPHLQPTPRVRPLYRAGALERATRTGEEDW